MKRDYNMYVMRFTIPTRKFNKRTVSILSRQATYCYYKLNVLNVGPNNFDFVIIKVGLLKTRSNKNSQFGINIQ